MTYSVVKQTIRAVMEETPLGEHPEGHNSFVYLTEGMDVLESSKMAPSRSFWLVARDASRKGPTLKGPAHIVLVVDIAMAYKMGMDADAIDNIMVEDYEAIISQLSDASKWGRPSSTIVTLLGDGGGYFPRQVAVGTHYRVQVVTIQVEHTL